MNLLLLGWLRPVRDANGERRQRLRPSAPTARAFNRSSASDDRNSRSGATAGCALDIGGTLSYPRLTPPLPSRGHGMQLRASQAANLSRLKVRPSNTP